MPNHVVVIIQAAKEVLDSLKGPEDEVDFNTVIPQPWNINTEPEGFAGAPPGKISWYEWNTSNWGTKWNAYDIKRISDDKIKFETAWCAPLPVLDALSRKFPNEVMKVQYADEDFGYNLNAFIMKNGEVLEILDIKAEFAKLLHNYDYDLDYYRERENES